MKNVGNSSRGRSQGVINIFRAPYWAHCAVIFAIAQLSCFASHCTVISSSWVNGSSAVTHDPLTHFHLCSGLPFRKKSHFYGVSIITCRRSTVFFIFIPSAPTGVHGNKSALMSLATVLLPTCNARATPAARNSARTS